MGELPIPICAEAVIINIGIKIKLNKAEKVDLMAFLLTLTDQQFLFNPALAFPKELLLLNRRKNE